MSSDDLLLEAILDRPVGDIANIVQMAWENEGTLFDRLSKGYYEITGNDGDPDEVIGLK
jgi:hypothetical protein